MNKSNPNTALHGANRERDSIRRHVRRVRLAILGLGASNPTTDILDKLLTWIDNRSLRYERKPGGLGTKRRSR